MERENKMNKERNSKVYKHTRKERREKDGNKYRERRKDRVQQLHSSRAVQRPNRRGKYEVG
jgi:hypothetical protein